MWISLRGEVWSYNISSEMNTFQYDGREKRLSELKFLSILWLWLERTGNYRIHEFDWLKSILNSGLDRLHFVVKKS